jgi:hypothetical protein
MKSGARREKKIAMAPIKITVDSINPTVIWSRKIDASGNIKIQTAPHNMTSPRYIRNRQYIPNKVTGISGIVFREIFDRIKTRQKRHTKAIPKSIIALVLPSGALNRLAPITIRGMLTTMKMEFMVIYLT